MGVEKAEEGNMGDVMSEFCTEPNSFFVVLRCGVRMCRRNVEVRERGKVKWHVRSHILDSVVVIVNGIEGSETDNVKMMELFLGLCFCRVYLLRSFPCHLMQKKHCFLRNLITSIR